MDISAISNAELMRMIGGGEPAAPASTEIASLSDADLMKALGRTADMRPAPISAMPSPTAPAAPRDESFMGKIVSAMAPAGPAAASALSGIPIAGAYVPEVAGAIASGISTADPIIKAAQAKDVAASVRKSMGEYEQAHPVASTLGQIATGTAITAPLGLTVLGSRLLGIVGGGLARQIPAGIASGAGISALDAAARGNDPMTAAMIGGGIGGIVPPASRLVGALAAPAISTIRNAMNPTAAAERIVGTTLARDIASPEFAAAAARGRPAGLTGPEMTAAAAEGRPVVGLNVGGESTRGLGRMAANVSPEARQELLAATDRQFEGQATDLADWLQNRHHFPNAPEQIAAIEQAQRTSGNQLYTAARNTADQRFPQGIWSPELERLTSSPDVVAAMRAAAESGQGRSVAQGMGGFRPGVTFDNGMVNFRRGPTGVPTYPDLRFWDYTYQELRDARDRAFRAGSNSLGGSLNTQLRSLRGELDRMVPEFQHARQTYAQFGDATNALEAGQNFVNTRMQNREIRDWLAQRTPVERQLFQDGFIDRFTQQLRSTPDRRSILNTVFNSPEARERFAIAAGGVDRANEVEAYLRITQIMEDGRRAIQGNSTTARQLMDILAPAGAYGLMTEGNFMNPDPGSIMTTALVAGAMRGRHAVDARVMRQVGNLLASGDPGRINTAINMAAHNQPILNALRNTHIALTRAAGTEASR